MPPAECWPCVFSVECHLESATVLSLPHMPEITKLAAGDTFWAQAGKNFSGKSLESYQVCCIAPVWPCTAPWLDAGSTSGEMEGFPLPSHRSELFLPEQNEGKKHVVLVWWNWFSQMCMDSKASSLKTEFRGSKLNKT